MATFLLKRLGLMVLTLWILSLIVFLAGQILPGDPGRAILGNLASQSSVQALDHQLGVDRPLITQYLGWIGGLLHGNLGESYTYQSAARTKGSTAVWYVYDVPMLPCSRPPIQLRYWVISGRSTPRCWSRACTALFAANGPRMKRPGSPGRI